jgi:hypothetical protein
MGKSEYIIIGILVVIFLFAITLIRSGSKK